MTIQQQIERKELEIKLYTDLESRYVEIIAILIKAYENLSADTIYLREKLDQCYISKKEVLDLRADAYYALFLLKQEQLSSPQN